MTPIVEKYFLELSKYEKNGIRSMDWAECAHEIVYENFISKMLLKDWLCIKHIYKKKSDNIKSLLASQIHFSDEIVNFSESVIKVKFEILIDLIITEKNSIAFQALMGAIEIIEIDSYYNYTEDIKIKLEKIKKRYIDLYFDDNFKIKLKEIVDSCSEYEYQKKEIYYKLNKINQ